LVAPGGFLPFPRNLPLWGTRRFEKIGLEFNLAPITWLLVGFTIACVELSETKVEINALRKVISNYRKRFDTERALRDALEISETIMEINELCKDISN